MHDIFFYFILFYSNKIKQKTDFTEGIYVTLKNIN